MPESKAEFHDLILTNEERLGIMRLKEGPLPLNEIPAAMSLKKLGFITLNNPETIKPDGYGGFISNEIYTLSEKYFLYVDYLKKNKLEKLLTLASNAI